MSEGATQKGFAMPLPLPAPIELFMSSENTHDLEALADCLAAYGTVEDEGQTIQGLTAIKAWRLNAHGRVSGESDHARFRLHARRRQDLRAGDPIMSGYLDLEGKGALVIGGKRSIVKRNSVGDLTTVASA
jgi:hypothetical protein